MENKKEFEDIRLEKVDFEYKGKTYELEVNFFVLADIMADIGFMPNPYANAAVTMKYYPSFLAAMLNDAARKKGWPERFTSREIGLEIDPWHLPTEDMAKVINLLIHSMFKKSKQEDADETDGELKNPETSQNP